MFRGSLAVGRDSFGRVLLIDVINLVVVRMWKSYRDAQAGWIVGAVPDSILAKQQAHVEHDQPQLHAWSGKKRRADSSLIEGMAREGSAVAAQQAKLYLVLYAPRRRSLELWQMRHGARVASASVPAACKLLPRPAPFGLQHESADLSGHQLLSQSRAAGFDQCLILDVESGRSVDVLEALQRSSQ